MLLHQNEQLTVPLQIQVGKTVVLNGRPWKLAVEMTITPGVKNHPTSLFGLGDKST